MLLDVLRCSGMLDVIGAGTEGANARSSMASEVLTVVLVCRANSATQDSSSPVNGVALSALSNGKHANQLPKFAQRYHDSPVRSG